MIEIKLEEAILTVQGLKLELRKTDMEIDNIISESRWVFEFDYMLFEKLINFIILHIIVDLGVW